MIKVRISASKIVQLEHDIHIANYVMKQLKEAGIPIVGTVLPRVETGTLSQSIDEFDTGDWVYAWSEV